MSHRARRCAQVLRAIMRNEFCQLFFNDPVDPEALGIPQYREIVKVSGTLRCKIRACAAPRLGPRWAAPGPRGGPGWPFKGRRAAPRAAGAAQQASSCACPAAPHACGSRPERAGELGGAGAAGGR
jgi:hypothetical protein